MPVIQQLPPSVINKIAAGEVIERPASVVKELVENSVDAGARQVEVSLGPEGIDLIRVADDGCGIDADQLLLAVASHATSKLQDADDLFRVATLGFRGEALASISEISRFCIRSRTAQALEGAQLEITAGRLGRVEPCGMDVGTTIEVRDLFLNTPVRRKFLKSSATELAQVTEAFTRVALAYPDRRFVLRHKEKLLIDAAPTGNWRERITCFFGEEIGRSLIHVEGADGEVRLSGFIADPSISRGNNRLQYVFLNGRCIRDRALQHALSEAYRGLLLTGRFPVAFLRLEMPPDMVDVNVHPTKMEVRFLDGGRIYGQLLGSIRRKFLSTDLTARVDRSSATAPAPLPAPNSAPVSAPSSAPVSAPLPGTWGSPLPAPTAVPAVVPTAAPAAAAPAAWTPAPLPAGASAADRHRQQIVAWAQGQTAALGSAAEKPAAEEASAVIREMDPRPAVGVQLHQRYLVTEIEDGILIIDQHALHERVLYEQFRTKILAGPLETQRLLVPEPVTLTPTEQAAVLGAAAALAQLGLLVEPFGGDTVLVTGYPAMLTKLGPREVLRQVVDQLLQSGKALERRDMIDTLLHMMSCKAAVKAGDPLTPAEISALLAQRHLFQDTHHCPHGRPTALVFTNVELDRMFQRI
ncbi:MAG: DNA mismatch repair endonuclease MutL [Planctomycetota bacterium]